MSDPRVSVHVFAPPHGAGYVVADIPYALDDGRGLANRVPLPLGANSEQIEAAKRQAVAEISGRYWEETR